MNDSKKHDVIDIENDINETDSIELVEGELVTSSITRSLMKNADILKNSITRMLYSTPSFIQAVKASIPKSDANYKLMFTKMQKNGIKNGTIELLTKKDGTLLAILRNSKNKRIASTVSLKKLIMKPELLQSITSYTTQLQIGQIATQIHHVQLAIEEVRQGQIDDRFALAYSCEQKLLQASKMDNNNLKNMALLQIVSDAEDSRNTLMKRQLRNLKYIEDQPESFWKQVFSLTDTKKIDKRMVEIRESFNAINMVSIVEAIAYQEMGELKAAKQSLEYYSTHLQECYFKTKGLLDRLDLLDESPEHYWSKNLPNIEKSVQLISSNNDTITEGEIHNGTKNM